MAPLIITPLTKPLLLGFYYLTLFERANVIFKYFPLINLGHLEPLFKKLKVLKVNDILQLQELKFYYKFVRVKLPVYLQNLPFYPNRSYHDFNTRTFDDIHINRIKHEFAKRCIRYDIPLIVNNTSILIKNKIVTHSLHGFSCYVKKHLLQNYQNLCSVPNCYICQQSH